MIAITISTDWAPELLLNYTLNLLDDQGIPATFFCTDDLRESIFPDSSGDHELAIHPNYDDRNYVDETDVMIRNFPHAIGSRSHRFMHGTPILNELKKHNIKYDSSILSYHNGITPFRLFNGIIEVPVIWSDDVALRVENVKTVDINSDKICGLFNDQGIYVFNFHPIHLYLNTETDRHYQKSKRYYHDPLRLMRRVNRNNLGILNLFEKLMDGVHVCDGKPFKFITIKQWVKENGEKIPKINYKEPVQT